MATRTPKGQKQWAYLFACVHRMWQKQVYTCEYTKHGVFGSYYLLITALFFHANTWKPALPHPAEKDLFVSGRKHKQLVQSAASRKVDSLAGGPGQEGGLSVHFLIFWISSQVNAFPILKVNFKIYMRFGIREQDCVAWVSSIAPTSMKLFAYTRNGDNSIRICLTAVLWD